MTETKPWPAGELFSDDDFFLMDSGLVLLQVRRHCTAAAAAAVCSAVLLRVTGVRTDCCCSWQVLCRAAAGSCGLLEALAGAEPGG